MVAIRTAQLQVAFTFTVCSIPEPSSAKSNTAACHIPTIWRWTDDCDPTDMIHFFYLAV